MDLVTLLPHEREALCRLIRENACGFIAEIGSCLGQTAIEMVGAGARMVYCVDTWKGSSDPEDICNNRYKNNDVFAQFLETTHGFIGNTITPLVGTSEQYAKHFGRWLDMVFIDADRSYEHVKQDIALWTPHVCQEGIVCGHDIYEPGVRKAVEESGEFEVLEGTSIWWRFKE